MMRLVRIMEFKIMPAFAEIYERIKLATNSRTQVELAEVLDIRQSSISDAKRRNSVPGDWFMKLFEKFGLSPDWLKQGIGPMYLRTEQGYMPQARQHIRLTVLNVAKEAFPASVMVMFISPEIPTRPGPANVWTAGRV